MFLRFYLLLALCLILLVKPLKLLVNYLQKRRRINKILKNVYIMDDYPIIGCALRFVGKNNEQMMDFMKETIFKNTTPFAGWLGDKCFVIVDKPEDIQTVTTSKNCIEKSDVYKFFNRGVGLFAAPASLWRPSRKQLSISFNPAFIQSFLPIFNEKSDNLARNVGCMIGKGEFDLKQLTSKCTLDIICETVMGIPTNVQNGEKSDYSESLTQLLSIITRRIVNFFYHPDIIYQQTSLYQEECKYLARTEAFTQKLIDQKMKAFSESNNNDLGQVNEPATDIDPNDIDENYEQPQIFIDRLLTLYKRGLVSEAEIKDQVNLIIFGGNDTSSHSTSVTILMLAMHPIYQDRVVDELDDIFDDLPDDCPITMEHVNKMTYLEQTMRESMRLWPSGPFLLRHCTEDTKISNDCTIPAGAEVMLAVATSHRRKDVWGADANEFNPDHFSSEAMSTRNPFSYMAFSQGPRNCIGVRFAYISLKIMLAKMLRKYQFSTNLRMDDLKMRLEVTSKLIPGAYVTVEERVRPAGRMRFSDTLNPRKLRGF